MKEEVLDQKQGVEWNCEICRKLGILLLKPDAVEELDITEMVIAHSAGLVLQKNAGELKGVFLLEPFKREFVALLYPNYSPERLSKISDFMCKGRCVLVVFEGDGTVDMSSLMGEIKGPKLQKWSLEALNGSKGLNNSIREMIPVPGTIGKYVSLMEKLKLRITSPGVAFTDDEYRLNISNLVHSPVNVEEMKPLLSLLCFDQLRECLSEDLLGKLQVAGVVNTNTSGLPIHLVVH